MRWLGFAILAYLVIAAQTSIAPAVAVHTIRPDLPMIVAVYFALTARASDALLACWIIGLMVDLTSLSFARQANVGACALAYGLLALFIVKVRDLTFRDSMATHVVFTFLGEIAVGAAVGFSMSRLGAGRALPPGDAFTQAFYAAVYTVVLAPHGYWIMRRFRGALGLGSVYRVRLDT